MLITPVASVKALLFLPVIFVLTVVLFPTRSEAVQLRKCGQEIESDFNNFKQKMRYAGYGQTLNTKKNLRFVKWLEAKKASIIKHEQAHKKAAGQWGGKIIYKQFEYWGVKYPVAGCVPLKANIKPKLALKAALAPENPSSIDRKLAARAEKAMKAEKEYKGAKKALANCKKIRHQTKRYKCLKKNNKSLKGHFWLKVKAGKW